MLESRNKSSKLRQTLKWYLDIQIIIKNYVSVINRIRQLAKNRRRLGISVRLVRAKAPSSKPQAASNKLLKRQASSNKRQAPSSRTSKHQAPSLSRWLIQSSSPERQASSDKPQATSSCILLPLYRYTWSFSKSFEPPAVRRETKTKVLSGCFT